MIPLPVSHLKMLCDPSNGWNHHPGGCVRYVVRPFCPHRLWNSRTQRSKPQKQRQTPLRSKREEGLETGVGQGGAGKANFHDFISNPQR